MTAIRRGKSKLTAKLKMPGIAVEQLEQMLQLGVAIVGVSSIAARNFSERRGWNREAPDQKSRGKTDSSKGRSADRVRPTVSEALASLTSALHPYFFLLSERIRKLLIRPVREIQHLKACLRPYCIHPTSKTVQNLQEARVYGRIWWRR